jgi:multicomponent Na+:H+ antiporter subunit B
MSPRTRTIAAGIVVVLFGAFFAWGLLGLQDFGHWTGLYGRRILHVAVSERQATNVVSAVNFDYRMFDTLIEELILFTTVMGVMLVLREQRGEDRMPAHAAGDAEGFSETSDGVRVLGVVLIGFTILLGLYIVAHGALTPGGGFQGGVILGAGVLLVFLAGEFVTVKRLHPVETLEVIEAVGAGGFAALGLGGLIAGGAAFHNFISTGTSGMLISAGTIPLSNLAVGCAVFGAIVILASELLEQALIVRR